MSTEDRLPRTRFLDTLGLVRHEGKHLAYSLGRVFSQPVNGAWVRALEQYPEQAERLEAFVSRYGRMQDTIGEKLLPRWLLALAETPGSAIETLQRAERLGVLRSAESWLEARKLRNLLVHEYRTDPDAFATDINLAREYSLLFFDTYNRVRTFAAQRMALEEADLPALLPIEGATDFPGPEK